MLELRIKNVCEDSCANIKAVDDEGRLIMRLTVAAHISSLLTAMENCQKRIDNPNNSSDDKNTARHWFKEHCKTIERLVSEHMPSGSGFDNGTYFDDDNSTPERLIFRTSFHHMNDVGMYDGWTDHKIIVTPSFTGINLRISGRNRDDIKDHIHEMFTNALETEIDV